MKMDRFMMIGMVIVIIIAVLAPFLASSNPDGLESAASNFPEAEDKEGSATEAPMPDYVVPALGDGPVSGVVAIVLGTLLVLAVTLGAGKLMSRERNENS